MKFEKAKFFNYVNEARSTLTSIDSLNSEYFFVTIIRWHNQWEDWVNEPELAKKNYHHPKDDLQDIVVAHLVKLEMIFEENGIEFDSTNYLDCSND